MFLSIFSDEVNEDLQEAALLFKKWGLGHADFRSNVLGKKIHELSDAELKDLKQLMKDNNLQTGALQTSLAKVHLPDADRRAAEAEKLEGIIRAADALDCRLVRVFHYWQPGPEDQGTLHWKKDILEQVADMTEPLLTRAKEAGLVLAFENCGVTPDEVLAFLDIIDQDEWGLAWDCYNSWEEMSRDQEDACMDRLIPRSKMVHVKAMSIVPELTDQPLPWQRILRKCADLGLKGPVSIETHNPKTSSLTNTEVSKKACELIRENWPKQE